MNGARYAYLEEICNLVERGEDIVIVSEDYAAPVFDEFRVKHPSRFLSVGIAEQNGMAVACGLALAGKYPIVYGCAPFPLTRAIDQMKSAVTGMHLPMTILNSGIGFGVPEFGATHYNSDDISLVRAMPGIRIFTPTDNIMARQFANYSLKNKSPIYLRMDKNCEGELYIDRRVDFDRGFAIIYEAQEEADAVIVSCGYMIHEVLKLAQEIKKDGINLKVIDLYGLPFNISLFGEEIDSLPIISVEEHILQGGIGSILLETLNACGKNNPIFRFGINFQNGYPEISGSREYFMEMFGLGNSAIKKRIKNICEETKNEFNSR